MSNSDWRMMVTFGEAADAETLAGYVENRREIAAAGGSLSFAEGEKRLFFYAPSGEAIRVVAGVVRSEAERLGIAPTGVTADEWLSEESRWSDERGRAASGTGDIFDAVPEIIGWFFTRP